jgi:hypothetical protein
MSSAGSSAPDTGSNNTSWTTYHYLPEVLVADNDVITNDTVKTSSKSGNTVVFDIPVADDYFMGLLGGEILTKTGTSPPSITNTVNAIENTRLIALYFRCDRAIAASEHIGNCFTHITTPPLHFNKRSLVWPLPRFHTHAH